MKQATREFLESSLQDLRSLESWLRRSYELYLPVCGKSSLQPEDYDAIEALTSRYARTIDLLVRKLFRAIDAFELETGGSLLDTVLRAEKRGLIPSSEQVRLMTELRNEIIHDYAHPHLEALFGDVMESTPAVFEIMEKTQAYSQNILSKTPPYEIRTENS